MVNFYCDLIPDLATKAESLRSLTRKNVKFSWTNQHQQSFADLKQLLTTNISVFIFEPGAPTFVTTDASNFGIGGPLSQVQNGREVPIAFGSHTLSQTERNYSASERECKLACIYFVEHWEKFLYGRNFTLRTDHQALEMLLNQPGKRLRPFDRVQVFSL